MSPVLLAPGFKALMQASRTWAYSIPHKALQSTCATTSIMAATADAFIAGKTEVDEQASEEDFYSDEAVRHVGWPIRPLFAGGFVGMGVLVVFAIGYLKPTQLHGSSLKGTVTLNTASWCTGNMTPERSGCMDIKSNTAIPGSTGWMSCKFHANTHVCGDSCCCDEGTGYKSGSDWNHCWKAGESATDMVVADGDKISHLATPAAKIAGAGASVAAL